MGSVKFRCLKCKVEEDVPENIVEMMDNFDGGDLSVPPRFNCEMCMGGIMEPIDYTTKDGRHYKIK